MIRGGSVIYIFLAAVDVNVVIIATWVVAGAIAIADPANKRKILGFETRRWLMLYLKRRGKT